MKASKIIDWWIKYPNHLLDTGYMEYGTNSGFFAMLSLSMAPVVESGITAIAIHDFTGSKYSAMLAAPVLIARCVQIGHYIRHNADKIDKYMRESKNKKNYKQ